MYNHIGTETRTKLLPAVRNIGQWAKAWSSDVEFLRTAKKNTVFMVFGCKKISQKMIMTLICKEVVYNLVPAYAVIQGQQALFGMIGRKELVGGSHDYKLNLNFIIKKIYKKYALEYNRG
jgi:hypothetical protein